MHVLRNDIILKARDWVHITLHVFTITYFIMTSMPFIATNLLTSYIESLIIIRDPNTHRKPNLALGHLISYILLIKYDLSYPATLDHIPSFFINLVFYIFYNGRRHNAQGDKEANSQESHTHLKISTRMT